uniref:Karst (inferred by orthology to a D. melanogaster protein) n=1 Tax=Strongyloides venezuelensis TaxID=75913 RepID=A0A0K0EWJ5_STRVS
MSRYSNQYHSRYGSNDTYSLGVDDENSRRSRSPASPYASAAAFSTYDIDDQYRSNNSYAIPSTSPPINNRDEENLDNPTAYFETNRITYLQDERTLIQKKTFTKWCNSYLNKARLEINDLFVDLGDGILLMKFLEIISGDKLGKPNRGQMRVQKIENLNKCINYLKRRNIHLENIGAEDILDGNERLILGLIWTIILRFSIDNIVIDDVPGEKKQAKEALLLWCQRKTAGYTNVKVENFTTSWRSGLAFNALIHAHRPDIINYSSLNPNDSIGNLNNAFDIAEKKLDIAKLLNAEDVNRHPDEKSIVTYVSLYYHYFAKQKMEDTAARRVGNFVGKIMEQDKLEDYYEALSSDILKWINDTITWLESDVYQNSLKGIQKDLLEFKEYRTIIKPPKFQEMGELEARFFEIQTKRKALSRKNYIPPKDRTVKDVQDAWARLEVAESVRQVGLIEELRRQERLEQLAMKFYKKAQIRESWLRDRFTAIQSCEKVNLNKINDAVKMVEALAADIYSQEEKFLSLNGMAKELCVEGYHDYKKISEKDREISIEWDRLKRSLEIVRSEVKGFNDLTDLLAHIDELEIELTGYQNSLLNAKIGKHLLGVEYFIEEHKLLETDIRAKEDSIRRYEKLADKIIRQNKPQAEILSKKLSNVKIHYNNVVKLCRERCETLNKARRYFLFLQNYEEELVWLEEKENLCEGMLNNKDISTFQQTSKQFKLLDTEIQAHKKKINELLEDGQSLLPIVGSKDEIKHKMEIIQSKFDHLRKLASQLAKWLEEAEEARRYFQDANEAESWINEKMPLVKSTDYGHDLSSAENLLSRHRRIEEDILSYRSDILRLDEAAQKLSKTQFTSSQNTSTQISESVVPKIKVTYSYEGNGLSVYKGEIVALMDKTNDEWWRILKQTGQEGYIPANHCKILPGETVVITQQIQTASSTSSNEDAVQIHMRQEKINNNYRKLVKLSEKRSALLVDATKLFKFYNECNAFREWASEVKNILLEEIPTENLDAYRVKFNKLEGEIKTNGGTQLKNINDMAESLNDDMHSQSSDIKDHKDQVNLIWNDLQKILKQKGIDLMTLEKVQLFTENCNDLKSWMEGKYHLLSEKVPSDDIDSLRLIQRRYQNLERDLAPLKKQMSILKHFGEEIKGQHPKYASMVDKQLKELSGLHSKLLRYAEEKINLAKQGQEQQIFDMDSKKLSTWLEKTMDTLMEDISGNSSPEDLLKRHNDLGTEIDTKEYEFDYLRELGMRLLEQNPSLDEVTRKCNELENGYGKVKKLWDTKKYNIEKLMDFRLFMLEADRIDAVTKGHEAFLNIKDLGDSVEAVENLIKRHKDFESKLFAQEDRIKTFSHNADLLIKNRHPESEVIDARRNQVLERRDDIYKLASQRNAQLHQALSYQALRRDAFELNCWMVDKKGILGEEDLSDPSALRRHLQRHEKFAGELKSNYTRLQNINSEGEKLINQNHSESKSIRKILDNLNSQWQVLSSMADVKGMQLQQADGKKVLEAQLKDVNDRLDETLSALKSKDYGCDLTSVKKLITKQVTLDTEILYIESKVQEIGKKGQEMVNEGHYDSDNILNNINNLITKFNGIAEPVKNRKIALNESLKLHQLNFDADLELQWIKEKLQIVKSAPIGNSLTEASNLLKKHDQLEAEVDGHQKNITDIVKTANDLIKEGHKSSGEIKMKSDQLNNEWNHLRSVVNERKGILEYSLQKERFLFDVGEIEAWIVEKCLIIEHTKLEDIDEIGAQKFSARLKSLENDMIIYKGLLERLSEKNKQLCKQSPPEDVIIFQGKEMKIREDFERLKNLINAKKSEVNNYLAFQNYKHESEELEEWINEQLKIATSSDYGRDYEHSTDLKNKFDEFVQNVQVGSQRFVQCENAVAPLTENNPNYTPFVLKRQEDLRSAWKLLLDYIHAREVKLNSFENLHKFNSDVEEMLQRLEEKKNSMSSDLGRDLKQTIKLKTDHEVFQHEVGSMESSVQDIISYGATLISEYPEETGKAIEEKNALLAGAWNDLRDAVVSRRSKLLAAYDLQRFSAEARDLVAWCDMIIQEMMAEQSIKDLQVAEWILTEHERLKAEIDGRESDFDQVIAMGREMIERKHYASNEIEEKIYHLKNSLKKLIKEWGLRNQWLYQVVQFHGFQREAKQIISAIKSKDNTIKGFSTVSLNVTDVETQLKKLETQKKALISIEKRVDDLGATAAKLIAEGHMETSNITKWDKEVRNNLLGLNNQVEIQENNLVSALNLAKLESSIMDMRSWIDEKQRKIDFEKEEQEKSLSLEEKMKLLKKHQAIEAEINSNQDKVSEINVKLNELKNTKLTKIKEEILEQGKCMNKQWHDLIITSRERSAALEEARDLLNFNQLVERVLKWINDKELMLTANDMGRDLEHCSLLLDKLVGTRADVSVDDSTVQNIHQLGDKLLRQGNNDQYDVERKLNELTEAWKSLKGRIDKYHKNLLAAKEVHQFNRDVDDTDERIHEKYNLLQSEDAGKDLSSVSALIRKQDAIERDMTAIHAKLKAHDVDAEVLLGKDAPLKDSIITSLRKLEVSWEKLAEAAHSRRLILQQSSDLHKYFDDVKKAEQWSNQMRTKITSYATPKSVADAAALMDSHKEKWAEIENRQTELKVLREYGQTIISEQPQHKSEIQRTQRRLQNVEHQLRQCWENENQQIKKYLEIQQFYEMVLLTESWLAAKEAIVSQKDYGDSLEAVNALLKKHDNFVSVLHQQSDKIQHLKDKADSLEQLNTNDVETEKVFAKYNEVLERYEALNASIDDRRSKLLDSRALHDFLKTNKEFITWMNAKLQLAYDDTFIDATNLRTKLQKHTDFDSEISANESRLQVIIDEGTKLIRNGHSESELIRAQLDEVGEGWSELKAKSANTLKLLKESYEVCQLQRKLGQLDKWMDQIEIDLSSDDHGKDVISVEALIKKHGTLQTEIIARKDIVNETVKNCLTAKEKGYENIDSLMILADQVKNRYNALAEPCQIRKENLEDAYIYYSWVSQANDEIDWINEMVPKLSSNDYGDSLQAAQSLSKKHQILQQEVVARESALNEIQSAAFKMIKSNHFATNEITEKLDKMNRSFAYLNDLLKSRQQKLSESLLSQQYYGEACEAEQWVRDRMSLATNNETGSDQASADSHLRRLTALEKEVKGFEDEIKRLEKVSNDLIDKDHFDSDKIQSKQNNLNQLYSDIKVSCKERRQQLINAYNYYNFVNNVDNLSLWLSERERMAASEDYGNDLEECQELIEKFEQVIKELSSSGEKVSSLQRTHDELLRSSHPFAPSIKAKGTELTYLWSHVNDLANERQQALNGAKLVHEFDQTADQTMSWLQEKEAMMAAMEQEDLTNIDLESIKMLYQKHNVFVNGLGAVEKKVDELCKNANKLQKDYPATQEHISVRIDDMVMQLNDIKEDAQKYYLKLSETENHQAYFQEYRDLLAFAKGMQSQIVSEVLPRDVPGCEALNGRHKEYKQEIETRTVAKNKFISDGQKLISQNHVLSNEISEKINYLEEVFERLIKVWKNHADFYAQNMDLRQWLYEADMIEKWLNERQNQLTDEWCTVSSVEGAEKLIRDFDDFLVTLGSQEEKVESIKRLTMLEKNYSQMKERENQIIMSRSDTQENRRDTQAIKIMEKKDILKGKRADRERRRTQEVSIVKRSPSGGNGFGNEPAYEIAAATLPRNRNKSSIGSDNVITHELLPPSAPIKRATSGEHVEALRKSTELIFTENASDRPLTLPRKSASKTPGFSTRRNQSIVKIRNISDIKAIDMFGYVERKHDLQSGGKKAPLRSWKSYYMILCGQLLCFFKDEESYMENAALAPPVYILGARCRYYPEYVKRKNVFKLTTTDGSEYLFSVNLAPQMQEWINKIQFHASLAPKNQLESFDNVVDSIRREEELNERGSKHLILPPPKTIIEETEYDSSPKKIDESRLTQHYKYEDDKSIITETKTLTTTRFSTGQSSPTLSNKTPLRSMAKTNETEFVEWMENSQSSPKSINSSISQIDGEEGKVKKKGFSLFKRNSKRN